MGTRNLTIVYMDGEYKVAQYGQFDGYPEGQGLTCLNFLRDEMNESLFRERLKKVRFGTDEEINLIFKSFGAGDDGLINYKDYDRLGEAYPALHRSTAAEILSLIQSGSAQMLVNDISFAADNSCEWAYVIDLDKRTFEVYSCYDVRPYTEDDRFNFLARKQVLKLVSSWSIDDLPTENEFLKQTSSEDDEEEEWEQLL